MRTYVTHLQIRFLTGLAALTLATSALAAATPPGNAYLVHNLVADQPGIADNTDPNMVNPWGLYTTASSPFWVNDAGTGLATVYSSAGVPSATKPAFAPSAKGTTPAPGTGGVANATGGFMIQGKVPNFIFVTTQGTVSGYVSSISTAATQLAVDNSSKGAIYYGLAISATTTSATPMLYAANFFSGGVDVFDTNYNPVTLPGTPFVDPAVPAGYAPFNIWNLGGQLYVTWAKQSSAKTSWVTGAGLGAVSIFNLNGALVQHIATGGALNAPWGVAIAPASFGAFANDLLVGNFGDGTINAFNPTTGAALGALTDQNGNPISISGLWALLLGNGGSGGDANAIYFTAGTDNQLHGLIGSVQATPSVTSVSNAASGAATIASNAYISIFGADLAPITRNWTASDFSGTSLPTSLDGVSVTVNGKPSFVYYISPKQIDVLTPVDTTTGTVPVVVTDNGLVSASTTATMAAYSPAFFLFKDNLSVAAVHSGGGLVGAATLYSGASTPALPGETITIFGTGFGPTNPAISNGTIVAAPLTVVTAPTVTIGGIAATVAYAGLVSAGVYQLDVVVPLATPAGNAAVVAQVGGVSSSATAIVTVQ
jgi:uncharacterized protein (TIGR03118 family)